MSPNPGNIVYGMVFCKNLYKEASKKHEDSFVLDFYARNFNYITWFGREYISYIVQIVRVQQSIKLVYNIARVLHILT